MMMKILVFWLLAVSFVALAQEQPQPTSDLLAARAAIQQLRKQIMDVQAAAVVCDKNLSDARYQLNQIALTNASTELKTQQSDLDALAKSAGFQIVSDPQNPQAPPTIKKADSK